MRLNNSEDTASKLVVSILDMESFFGFILSDSMIFNSFFNYTFICKKLVSELRRFGTTEELDIGVITSVPGAAKGIAAKMNIEKLLDIKINSCNLFRRQIR